MIRDFLRRVFAPRPESRETREPPAAPADELAALRAQVARLEAQRSELAAPAPAPSLAPAHSAPTQPLAPASPASPRPAPPLSRPRLPLRVADALSMPIGNALPPPTPRPIPQGADEATRTAAAEMDAADMATWQAAKKSTTFRTLGWASFPDKAGPSRDFELLRAHLAPLLNPSIVPFVTAFDVTGRLATHLPVLMSVLLDVEKPFRLRFTPLFSPSCPAHGFTLPEGLPDDRLAELGWFPYAMGYMRVEWIGFLPIATDAAPLAEARAVFAGVSSQAHWTDMFGAETDPPVSCICIASNEPR